jgi:molybdopterin molybdotransferase
MEHSISALILAGGRGTRMGRVDKGLQPFRGGTLASHVLQRLAPQVASVTINANRNQGAYSALGVDVLPDELEGYEGPLAGLQTGLRHCATELLLTAPCDSPFLPADLAQRLYDALHAQGADLAVAATLETDEAGNTHTQLHPVFCLVRKSALPALDAYLQTGARKMDGWYKSIKVAEVLFNDAAAFRNINTLAELQKEEEAAANPSLKDVASCLASYDPDALPVRHAQRIIREFIQPVRGVEKVALRTGWTACWRPM